MTATTTTATTTAGERGAAVRFPFPPALFAAPLAASLALHRRVPRPLPGAGSPVLVGAGAAAVAAGAALMATGVAAVVRNRTTVVPHRPVTRLVASGPYRITRNPMYAGMALVAAGTGLAVGSWWPLAAAAASVVATTELVIKPEEEYLAGRFGADYDDYRSRARRWL